MQYTKINLELIAVADEAEAVIADLNAALDQMDKRHTLFGGGMETVNVEHSGRRCKSALMHTVSAAKTTVEAVRSARNHMTSAMHRVV